MMATKLVGGRLKAFSGLATKEDFFIFGFPKKKNSYHDYWKKPQKCTCTSDWATKRDWQLMKKVL